jgi:hypothetical protein
MLAGAVVLATYLAERFLGRLIRWFVAAAVAVLGALVAYRLVVG